MFTIFRKAPPSVVSGYGKRSINLNKVVANFKKHKFLSQTDLTRTGIINNRIVTTRPFSLPCYLQGSENGRVVTIGKHSRINRQIWYRHPNSEAGNDEIQNVNMDY
jgi:hypothetical protein